MVDAADTALADVVTQIGVIRDAALEAATEPLSPEELLAKQAEIDGAIEAINTLASTSYGGKRLLDGSQDFTISGQDPNQFREVTVLSRATSQPSQVIATTVTRAAERAERLTYEGNPGALVKADAEFTLSGNLGSEEFSVTAGETLTAVRDRINAETYATGVSASVSGDNLLLDSTGYGSKAEIAVAVTDGTFVVTGGNDDGTANGVNGQATVNGQAMTADGLVLRYRSSAMNVDLELNPSCSTGTLNNITVSGSAHVVPDRSADGAPSGHQSAKRRTPPDLAASRAG